VRITKRHIRTISLVAFGLPILARAQEPARGTVDPKALALMDAVEAKMRAAKTIEVVKTNTVREPMTGNALGNRVIKVQVARPDRYRVQTVDADPNARANAYTSDRVSDGKVRMTRRVRAMRYNEKTKQREAIPESEWKWDTSIEQTADEDVYVWDDDIQTLAGLYVADDEHPGVGHDWRHHKLYEPTFNWIRYVGKEKWQGVSYDVIEWKYDIGIHPLDQQVIYTQKVYVGADTLVHRVLTRTSRGHVLEDAYKSITLNPSLSDSTFAIPADPNGKQPGGYRLKFTTGDVLPDFTLPAHGALGNSITFSKAVEGKKGAVVWFWGYH
jgi:hypothetical protein